MEGANIPSFYEKVPYYPRDYINKLLKQYYNHNFTKKDGFDYPSSSDLDNELLCNGYCFEYKNDKFYPQEFGNVGERISSIVYNHTQINDDLIMYVYAAYIGDGGIHDCYNDYFIENYSDTTSSYNLFEEHKKEFTKYKHTFKKNDTGYYWYSTEVV